MIKGRVHSIQTLGTVDGPGVRFVLFLQGCPLRCACCHNPDTWELEGGSLYTAEEILAKVLRYKEYFGKTGGITLSGGEPLLQSDFAYELFSLCKKNGIHTCLDTSGFVINESVINLLEVTDLCMLDIKYTTEEQYKEYVGGSLNGAVNFLKLLEEKGVKTWIRQVIIPTINDTEENVLKLKELTQKYSVIEKYELLPFRKICQTKYDTLGLEFRFSHILEPTKEEVKKLEEILIQNIQQITVYWMFF